MFDHYDNCDRNTLGTWLCGPQATSTDQIPKAYFQPCVAYRCQLIWPMFRLFRKVAAIITIISPFCWWKSLLCYVVLWIRASQDPNSSLKRLGPISHNGQVRSEQIGLSGHVSLRWHIYPGNFSHVQWVVNGPDVSQFSFVLLVEYHNWNDRETTRILKHLHLNVCTVSFWFWGGYQSIRRTTGKLNFSTAVISKGHSSRFTSPTRLMRNSNILIGQKMHHVTSLDDIYCHWDVEYVRKITSKMFSFSCRRLCHSENRLVRLDLNVYPTVAGHVWDFKPKMGNKQMLLALVYHYDYKKTKDTCTGLFFWCFPWDVNSKGAWF